MIFETDQFKQAKSVDIAMIMKFNVEDLEKFSHLKKFTSWLISENTFQDVPRLLDIISTFEKLESCELKFMNVWDESLIVVFAVALGAEIPIGPLLAVGEGRSITHRYQIPESNEFIEFKFDRCDVNIVKIR